MYLFRNYFTNIANTFYTALNFFLPSGAPFPLGS
jgi:hypothetical protein